MMANLDSVSFPIPNIPEPNWRELFKVTISEKNDPLVKLECHHERIQTDPVYHNMHLPGALPDIWLRQSVADKLPEVLNFLPDNLGLLVLDGWRPISVQAALRQNIENQIAADHPELSPEAQQQLADQFVARPQTNPKSPSPHLTGGSVDLTLFDCDSGKILDMGSEFDAPYPESWTVFYEESNDSDLIFRNRRRILYHAMRKAGFTNLPSEWWHFDYGNQSWAYFSRQPFAFFGAAKLD